MLNASICLGALPLFGTPKNSLTFYELGLGLITPITTLRHSTKYHSYTLTFRTSLHLGYSCFFVRHTMHVLIVLCIHTCTASVCNLHEKERPACIFAPGTRMDTVQLALLLSLLALLALLLSQLAPLAPALQLYGH